MKVAIIGYGKMGKEIEKILLQRNHTIVAKLTSKDAIEVLQDAKPDVAIEFTIPENAKGNIEFCLAKNIPVVVGTTGWLNHLDEITENVTRKEGALLYTSNFSVGVNVFFAVNQYLAKLMNQTVGYESSLREIHHTEKLDAPSGTGLSLVNQILENNDKYDSWENVEKEQKSKESVLSIASDRIPNVPGTHIVNYESEIDEISIKHVAHNRRGFALGAVLAAEFLVGKTGVFGMEDVLNLNNIKP